MNHILHDPVTIIFILATADIITGTIKALINREYKSHIFKKGLFTHIGIVLGLYLFQFYAPDFQLEPLLVPITSGFAVMYLSSLYENYTEMGGSLPPFVDKLLDKLKESQKDKDGEPD